MLLSAVSVMVVAQSSSEIPEGLMNNPVFCERSNANDKRVHLASDAPLSLTSIQIFSRPVATEVRELKRNGILTHSVVDAEHIHD